MTLPQYHGGTLTALKWAAVLLMVGDHVDWLLYGSALGIHDTLGRLVFPVFGFVLAYNLARPGAWGRGVHRRLIRRLVLIGTIAAPAYVYLAGLLPANIMFSLALFVGIAALLERGRPLLALLALLACGLFVDYQWPGLVYCLGVWAAYRTGAPLWLAAAAAGLLGLYVINGSHAALWALPLLWLASGLRLDLPRHQLAFYAVYPAHLVVLAVLM